MDCIKKFLQESYQSRLRLFAQGKSERYEYTLENYSQIFFAHLDLVKKEGKDCATCSDTLRCQKIRKVINGIKKEEIEQFFIDIQQVYLNWIKAEPVKAIQGLENLLKNKNLHHFERELKETDVFFKARVSKNILTQWDMFHIPFNKRYLIENQRYSLTGQPMIYIGSSVVDVAEEIEASELDNFKVSVVRLPVSSFKIYDLKNNIDTIYLEMVFDQLFGDDKERYTEATFYKLILSSICSFRKRRDHRGYSFCEEYVIPQILALNLKRLGFDGIAYLSTKKFEKVECAKENQTIHKENIAIFTNLSPEHVYDRTLYERMKISTPIDINRIEKVTIEELEEIVKEIGLSKSQEKISQSELILNSFKRNYADIMVNNEKYYDSKIGKLHLYQLYSILNEILVA